ncbi:hypothetical protein [Polaromonas sp.]|uniref:hypothetical protein n=1 Tax=Polaromonas sp. TaxID=1869339 RepID=UPI00352B2921
MNNAPIEALIEAATIHGQDSNPDHEAGDLQELLRSAWNLMSSAQRQQLLDSPAADATFEAAGRENAFRGSISPPVPSTEELLLDCIRSGDAAAMNPAPATRMPPPRRVVDTLSAQMQRWELDEGAEAAMPEEPTYDMKLELHRNRLSIEIQPAGAADSEPMAPAMLMTLEINHGLPCLHVHSHASDALQVSVFATPDGGIKIRPGDDAGPFEHMIADRSFSPDPALVAQYLALQRVDSVRAETPPSNS